MVPPASQGHECDLPQVPALQWGATSQRLANLNFIPDLTGITDSNTRIAIIRRSMQELTVQYLQKRAEYAEFQRKCELKKQKAKKKEQRKNKKLKKAEAKAQANAEATATGDQGQTQQPSSSKSSGNHSCD